MFVHIAYNFTSWSVDAVLRLLVVFYDVLIGDKFYKFQILRKLIEIVETLVNLDIPALTTCVKNIKLFDISGSRTRVNDKDCRN